MAKARILLIEDDHGIRQVIKFQLEAAGYDVTTATDGEEGIRAANAEPPDLVITDLMMPVMDGSEVCRRIKSHFKTSHIPVIMLTARADLQAKVDGLGFGANDFVAKPCERQELLLRVRNLLHWSRTQREASPLTGLPGNVTIEREVLRRLENQEPFLFLYLDVDNFKAYNDRYGPLPGDQAIRFLARTIMDVVTEKGTSSDLVGHVGGDDFIVLTAHDPQSPIPGEIIRRFDAEVPHLLTEDDRKAGFIQIPNRKGEMEQFPLMSVTIAAVLSERHKISHPAELSDIASELKRYGKAQKGSVAIWERRGEESEGRTGTLG